MTGEYYTRNEKELIPFQPPLPNTPHKEDQSHVTANSSTNENPSPAGIQKEKQTERSESPAPIVSHMTSFQFAPTPSISTARAPTMEIRFGDISSIPIQAAQENETISNNNGNNNSTLAIDKANSVKSRQEGKDDDDDDDDKKMKKKTENQLYSKLVAEVEVKPRSKKRHTPNKSAKIIPSLAQIERVTGKTKKGLPACFVGAKRKD